jgi:hypothetical protein
VPTSLLNTVEPFSVTPAVVEPLSAPAVGVTMIDTTAVESCPFASAIVYVKLSGPE